MTSTPPEPLDEPVDTGAQDVAGQDSGAAVSGSPAAADSDVGYSRGDEGESTEQAGNPGGDGSDFLESGTLRGSPGDEGNR